MTIHRHEILPSTSDEALRLARLGAEHGTIVTACQQTAGRGRQGRTWVSPPGNLHMSLLVRAGSWPAFTPHRATEIGFIAALAVAGAIDTWLAGSRLKWPNDVLLAGAKVAGILIEMAGDAIVIGIGINVAHAPPDLPYPVTSLAAHGVSASAEDVLDALRRHLEQGLADWQCQGFAPVREAWLRRGPAAGDALTARAGGATISGQFAGLASDGALLLATPDGVRRIVAGEVAQA